MDRFVVDLVKCPSVSRMSVVARTFGPAVSEEYSPAVFARGAVADVVVESDSALVSGLRSVVSDSALSVLPVVSSRPFFWGKVAFDAVGLGIGPPCFRVDSEEALLKRTDEQAPFARAAPGAAPEMKLVTKSWMVGRQEWYGKHEIRTADHGVSLDAIQTDV